MKIVLFVVAVIILLAAVLVVRTLMLKPTMASMAKVVPDKSERADIYGDNLAKLIRKETVSSRFDEDRSKFYEFHKLLEELYPNVHNVCEKHEFDGSLLFKWKGSGEGKPIMLMSHHDVVEANGEWKHEPFSGHIDSDGNIWGRGAVDTKASLSCIFQAIEELIKEGFSPKSDVYIASSCTEEWSGPGAPATARYLKDNGVRLELLLDEGGMIVEEPIKGVKGVYAMVGVVEKGYGDYKFTAKGNGGHASAPKKNTPLVRLGKFMADVDTKSPFKPMMTPTICEMFNRLAPNMNFGMKLIFANMWLFKPLLTKLLPSINSLAGAMIKTTIAFTKASGSEGLNVLPQEAYVTGNMRFIHHQPNKDSYEVISKLAKKYDIETEVIYEDEPCPIVEFKSDAFSVIEKVSHEVYPGIGVSPYIMTGGTDSKFYKDVCDNCIRFAPLYINNQQHASVHGLNENINKGMLPMGVDFYKKVVESYGK